MWPELRKSFNSILYDRIASPFYGALAVSWMIWNWKIIYLTVFISEESISKNKIEYIIENYCAPYNLFLYPLLSTIALISVVPFLTNGAFWLSMKFTKWRIDVKGEIEGGHRLTVDESIQLRKDFENSQEEFEKLIARTQKEKDLISKG